MFDSPHHHDLQQPANVEIQQVCPISPGSNDPASSTVTPQTEMDPTLVLYYRPTCPFCRKVIDYLHQSRQQIVLRDISTSSEWLEQLIDKGGKRQVPCLMIDGQPLYESDRIVDYLSTHLKESK